jgi:hypothetical protein
MSDYRARYLGSGTFRLLTNAMPEIPEGETVLVSIERGRSQASHNHQFAWLHDAWANLPERLMMQPWAETPETMRKHALIATGFCHVSATDVGTNAAAHRMKAVLLQQATAAHGYAITAVRGPVLTLWTPESQSVRAMGGERFKDSKTAILGWVSDQLGVTPDTLIRQGAPA